MRQLTLALFMLLGVLCWLISTENVLAQDAQQYQEPSTNAGGSPLTDLKQCTITVTDVFTGQTGSQQFMASSLSGGAVVDYSVASIIGGLLEGDYDLIGICSDIKGNVSVVSNTKTATFPSVPPSAPVLQ